MADKLPTVTDVPKFRLSSEYRVGRVPFPVLSVQSTECNYALGPTLTVLSTADLNLDGLMETIHVADLGATANPVGCVLSDLSSNDIGVISAVSRAADTTGVFTTTLTLRQGVAASALNVSMAIVPNTALGTPTYTPAPRGKTWSLTVWGNTDSGLQEIKTRMGNAYFNAAKAVLNQLALVVTDAALQSAIQTLAQNGTNIDTFLAQEADTLESRRASGQLPSGAGPGFGP